MRNPIKILLIASSLTGCTIYKYKANFPLGKLDCCIDVDNIHAPDKLPMALGDSEVVGSDPKPDSRPYGIKLSVTDPTPTDPMGNDISPSLGIFIEGLHFSIGSQFVESAIFRNPDGPHDLIDHVWAAGSVVARSGNHRDLPTEKRLNLALKVKGNHAVLAITDSNTPKITPADVPDDMYTSIFEKLNPYSLRLVVNRTTSKVNGYLKVATEEFPGGKQLPTGEFDLNYFGAEGEGLIETVGATVSIVDAPNSRVSVEVLNFELTCDSGSNGC